MQNLPHFSADSTTSNHIFGCGFDQRANAGTVSIARNDKDEETMLYLLFIYLVTLILSFSLKKPETNECPVTFDPLKRIHRGAIGKIKAAA